MLLQVETHGQLLQRFQTQQQNGVLIQMDMQDRQLPLQLQHVIELTQVGTELVLIRTQTHHYKNKKLPFGKFFILVYN
jgi:hypothetical protein